MVNRDTQRRRLYSAEREAFKKNNVPIFDLLKSKEYVSTIISSEYYTSHGGWKRVRVKDGRGCRSAYYFPDDRAIALPKWARKPWVIIHEMAHCLTHKTVDDSVGHHGSFCTHYANLVAELMGTDDARTLVAMFKKHRVLYQEHNLTFTLVPEQKLEKRDKRQKFKELSQKRLDRAVRELRLIGNLSNTGNYVYEVEEVEHIIATLRAEVSRAKTRFDRKLKNRIDARCA